MRGQMDYFRTHYCSTDIEQIEKEFNRKFGDNKFRHYLRSYYATRSGKYPGRYPEDEKGLKKLINLLDRAVVSKGHKTKREDCFDCSVKSNQGRRPKNETVKIIGNKILSFARQTMQSEAGDKEHIKFAANRWVYQRLALDEQKSKKEIKQAIWDQGSRTCRVCRRRFDEIKGLHLHRKDDSRGYSQDNCELLHKTCHERI